MIWSNAKLSPDARLLLDRERFIAALPASTRARGLARARAALAAGVGTRPIPPKAPLAVRWATAATAAAAALACLATVAAVAAAYQVGLQARPTTPPVAAPPLAVPTPLHPILVAVPFVRPRPVPMPAPAPAPPRASAVREELRLLQQASAAVAREDFVTATRLLAEHARRFKTGCLTEEREALRVRSLMGLDRRDDARRAATDFEALFPRSPLLPSISQMPDSAP